MNDRKPEKTKIGVPIDRDLKERLSNAFGEFMMVVVFVFGILLLGLIVWLIHKMLSAWMHVPAPGL